LEHLEPDDLAVEERHAPHRHRGEGLLDQGLVTALRLVPGLEVRTRPLRQHAVRDDQVGRVAEEVEVGEGALRLLDDHLLEVEDEAHRADGLVGEELLHVVEAMKSSSPAAKTRRPGPGRP